MLASRKHTRWTFALVMVLFITGAAVVAAVRSGWAQDFTVTPSPTRPPQGDLVEPVPLYEILELSFSLPRTYPNPYDPDVIDVTAAFRPPSGQTMVVPGFFMRPYRQTCVSNCAAEDLSPNGQPGWRVRFAPNQVGRWTYSIEARDSDGTRTIRQGSFEVIPSDSPGYVRVAGNQRYFEFDNSASYFPVGENLDWSWEDGGGIFTYERWLDRLSAAGANYARLNIDVPWFIGLDWPGPAGDYDAAQAAAWRMDTILQMAEEKGIYLQIVLLWHQAYATYAAPPVAVPSNVARPNTDIDWEENPYNTANGGPLSGPAAVFFDPAARTLLHQRMRYIVARWGYSPHIFAWEVVDEVDGILGYTPIRAKPWLQDAVTYLREVDPYNHLITAGSREPAFDLWQAADLDFTEVQFYQERPVKQAVDQVAGTLDVLDGALAHTNGPVLLTGFSLNPWFEPTADDPTGVHVRNTIWAAAFSGSAGSAMPWWWDTYIDHQNLYRIFTPLALYAREFPWDTAKLEPAQVGLVAEGPLTYEPLRVDDFNRSFPGESPPDVIYRLTADGAVPPTSQMSSYLYGQFNPERSRPQTFLISPPVDTELRISVQNVSSTAPAALVIVIDGVEVARVDFSADSKAILITLPITAGEHILVLDNPGSDWLQLEYIEIAQYRTPVRALALADRNLGAMLAWVHHRDYTWESVAQGNTPEPLDVSLAMTDMPTGIYRVTFWNTTTGNVIGEENTTVTAISNNVLHVTLPPLASQLAVRALRVAGPEVQPSPEVTRFVTRTPQVSLTPTPTATRTPTDTSTATLTYTYTPSSTPTYTRTPTATSTPTYTRTPTPTKTYTPTYTRTPSPTRTPTNTTTATDTLTPTATRTPMPTRTHTPSPTRTPTATRTNTYTPSPSRTPTATRIVPTSTPTATASPTPMDTATLSSNHAND
jgi:hypothetical protein